jgi:hypothetical protein
MIYILKCTLVQALKLCTGWTAHRGSRCIALLFNDHGTRRGECDAPAVFYPRKRPGTHCTGGWVGHRAGLDRCEKSRPPPGFDPRTVQPVASRYTDYAIRPNIRPTSTHLLIMTDTLLLRPLHSTTLVKTSLLSI